MIGHVLSSRAPGRPGSMGATRFIEYSPYPPPTYWDACSVVMNPKSTSPDTVEHTAVAIPRNALGRPPHLKSSGCRCAAQQTNNVIAAIYGLIAAAVRHRVPLHMMRGHAC